MSEFSVTTNKKKIIPFELGQVILGKGLHEELLRHGDHVKIYSKKEIIGDMNFVYVEGMVKRPGAYELYEENMTIHDLLFKSSGLEDLTFRDSTYLGRADIIRKVPGDVNQELIYFNRNL